ncbi:anthrone oxygenase family protein [Cellulomonas pakistanensis]|uniref:DUF1772 domain-containing protein n=1 Tax=Cellulomonas pakistanensis TaxID=992287 RepID=A0A919U6Z2_9CELL|nr:anthrone oxygenase family protein [Cellulomonas pakistanensis]GIG37524.1 hypothetical protein Cpa01nite_29050 [Cellulomonas pakistanensis]
MPGWLPGAVLGAAALASGLLAGLLWGFACAVVPGMRRAGPDAAVAVFRGVNAVIVRPVFLLVLLGAPVLAAAGVGLAAAGAPVAVPWAAAGLAGVLATLAVTSAVNVPINDRLARAALDGADARRSAWAQVDGAWHRANRARTATATAGTALLLVAAQLAA